MSEEAGIIIYNTLSNDPDVSNMVRHIRPEALDLKDELPSVIYKYVDMNPTLSLSGDTGNLDQVRVQIDSWAVTFEEANKLSSLVRIAMDNEKDHETHFIGDLNVMTGAAKKGVGVQTGYYLWVRPFSN